MTERTRQSSMTPDPETYSYLLTNGTGGTCTTGLSLNSVTVSATSQTSSSETTMIDTVTPNYYARIASGEIINSPLYKHSVITVEPPYSWHTAWQTDRRQQCPPYPYDYKWFPYSSVCRIGLVSDTMALNKSPLTTKYLPLTPIDQAEVTRCKNLAITQAWANIDHSEILALAALAESGKTVNTLRDTLGKALRIVKAVRKKSWKLMKKEFRPKEVADMYMQARYGLRPLYYDAQGSLLALTAKKRKTKDRYTFRGKQVSSTSASDSGQWTTNIYAQAPYCTMTMEHTRRTTNDIIVRAGVLTRLDLLTNAEIYGFNSLAETAWELVPLSFVVDWFGNVGATIGAWTPKAGVSSLASWVTTECLQTQKSIVQSLGFTNSGGDNDWRSSSVAFSVGGEHNTYTSEKVREISPQLQMIPELKVNLSGWKLLDLALIGKQFFKESSMLKRGRF